MMKKIWEYKISQFGVIRKGGRLLYACAANVKVKKSFYRLKEAEMKDYKMYLKQTSL